jgi:hypothetical protein
MQHPFSERFCLSETLDHTFDKFSSSPTHRHCSKIEQISQEMLGRHYEFECGFGFLWNSAPEEVLGSICRSIATDTGDAEDSRRRGTNPGGIMLSKFRFDALNEFLEPRRIEPCNHSFDHFCLRTNLEAPFATEV